MNTNILISNLTNPVLLFFILGVLATIVKSDLEIPASSAKFISLYLLFSIGFRGGQELVHSVQPSSNGQHGMVTMIPRQKNRIE